MNIPGELIPIVLFICAAAVAILAPISSKLGKLLEAMARERQHPQVDGAEMARVRTLVEHLTQRVELMEERIEFTERLVDTAHRPAIGTGAAPQAVAHARAPIASDDDRVDPAQSIR